MSNLKNVVYQRLDAIAAAEKITRVELSHMSRELLDYVPDSQDIDIVNRLLGVLTAMNRRVAILYFSHFLPWEKEQDNEGNFVRFGKKMQSAKKIARKHKAITEWLKDESNDIWSWSDTNIELKQKDLGATVTRAIKKALQGDEKTDTPAMTHFEVLNAVMDGGVTLDDMSKLANVLKQLEEAEKEEQQAAA